MRSVICLGLLLITAVSVSACGSVLVTDDRLRFDTAGVLGQPPTVIMISNRRDDGLDNTFYTAVTPRGAFACTVSGGSLVSMTPFTLPVCNRI